MASISYVGTAGAVCSGAKLLVDENGDYLVDELGNYLEVDQFSDLVTVSVQRYSVTGTMQAVATPASSYTWTPVQKQVRYSTAGAVAAPAARIACKAAPAVLLPSIAAPASTVTCKAAPAVSGKAVLSSFSTWIARAIKTGQAAAVAAPASTYTRAARIVGTAGCVAGPRATDIICRVAVTGQMAAVAMPFSAASFKDVVDAQIMAVGSPAAEITCHVTPPALVGSVGQARAADYAFYHEAVTREEVGAAGCVAAAMATDIIYKVAAVVGVTSVATPAAQLAITVVPVAQVGSIGQPESTLTVTCNPAATAGAVAEPGFDLVIACRPLALMGAIGRPVSIWQYHEIPKPTDLLRVCYTVTVSRQQFLADNYKTTVRRRY